MLALYAKKLLIQEKREKGPIKEGKWSALVTTGGGRAFTEVTSSRSQGSPNAWQSSTGGKAGCQGGASPVSASWQLTETWMLVYSKKGGSSQF